MVKQLRFPDTDGLDSTQIVRAEIDRQIGKLNQMQAFVPSRIFETTNNNRIEPARQEDEIRLVETSPDDGTNETVEFAGIFRELIGDGAISEIIVDSFERYALDAEPFAGGASRQGTDKQIIETIIDRIPNLSAGTVEQVANAGTVEYDLSHKSPARALRIVAESEGAELFYQPDGSVRYVESLGIDRTNEAVINPSNQTAVGEVEVDRKGRNQRVSHLRVLGAGEGAAQITSEAIADWYQNASSPKPRQSWRVVPNKEIVDQNVLDDYADSLIQELNEKADVTLTLTIPNNVIGTVLSDRKIRVGDEFRVTYNSEGITEKILRAIFVTEILEAGTSEYRVQFQTTKQLSRSTDSNLRRDTDRFNLSVNGEGVDIFRTGGQRSVNGSGNVEYSFDFQLPDEIISIRQLDVRVFGKTDSSGNTPSNCNVLVNGTSQNTSFGNGSAFIDSVDVTGDINTGEVNTVSVTSDTAGLLRVAVQGRLLQRL